SEPCRALTYDPSCHLAFRAVLRMGKTHRHALTRMQTIGGAISAERAVLPGQEQTAGAEITYGGRLRGEAGAGKGGIPIHCAPLVITTFPVHPLPSDFPFSRYSRAVMHACREQR